jgi:CheY-like chemotaxis protein
LARKILLADDSVTAQNMGRKILADAGYEVITVNNGSAALKKIAEQKPDLIVLDVYMPGYSGLEVCQRLKEAQETSRVPVLLTVGKLEPFKPEEAKRVRADGFIVKPFEASELLSALSKLEDKIVPRPETSKPGRFARVTAAIEEGRYDRTVAFDEDSGWKDRISFPPKKKEKSVSEDADSARIYKATEDQRKPVEKPREAKAEEARVDLGALAPEGLPKDVTPEEIAALAAAAAQVKGKIAENGFLEPPPAPAWAKETEETELAAELPQQLSSAAEPVATVAAQKSEEKSAEKIEEKIDAPQEKTSDAAAEAASVAAASHSDLIAAIAGLNPDAVVSSGTSLGDGFSSQGAADQNANEPVTMAMAAGAGSVGGAPRWTAVSVALGPEDAAISLEHEMQKAFAAFAAADGGHVASATAVSEARSGSVELVPPTESSSPSEPTLSEPVGSIPAMPTPEAAQTLSALANASTEAIRAAVQELEMVAESYVGETAAPAGLVPVRVAETEAAVRLAPETHQSVEAIANENPPAAGEVPLQEAAKLDTVKHLEPDSRHEEPKNQEWKNQYFVNEDGKNEEPSLAAASASTEVRLGTTADRPDAVAPTFVNEVSTERATARQDSSSMGAAAAVEPTAEGSGGMGKKESDAAANTAAAWASWRRIRESGDSKAASEEGSLKETEEASAAMAVAAGAEKTPNQASAESESDPAAIASIVDSVLADLRPKIFEEISRKMGKKK